MKKFILWASLVMLLFTGCNMQTQNLEDEPSDLKDYVTINIGSFLLYDVEIRWKYNETDYLEGVVKARPDPDIKNMYKETYFYIPSDKFNPEIFIKSIDENDSEVSDYNIVRYISTNPNLFQIRFRELDFYKSNSFKV